MPQWSGDFTGFSLEEVLRSQAENRTWHKELRLKNTALVNNRLAKRISMDEYAENRKLAHEETAECQRRAAILVHEISCRIGS
jgi:hypothetical protein